MIHRMLKIIFSVIFLFIQIATLCTYSLSDEQKKEIGLKIWHNETGKNYETLVFWNENEPFLSLGIGHFIWYPHNQRDIFSETFPALLDYLAENNIKLPYWLKKARKKGAPWKTKKEFDKNSQGTRIKNLRTLLFNTIDLQVDFIINHLKKSWPHILKHAHPKKRATINTHYINLLKSKNGTYALIDYVHFKGEGIKKHECYNGIAWGLLQVLEKMPPSTISKNAVAEFVKAAKYILAQRIQNAPSDKKAIEEKWLIGWQNRIDSYLTEL